MYKKIKNIYQTERIVWNKLRKSHIVDDTLWVDVFYKSKVTISLHTQNVTLENLKEIIKNV